MRDLLFIEYQYIRLYINSIAIQAVVERALAQNVPNDTLPSRESLFFTNVSGSDRALNAEVIDASCQILRKTVSLSKAGTLCFAPVRIYMRIISASIFLLKAISLGVGNLDLQVSLRVLDECAQALQNKQRLDEMHLSSRYGTLLARHVVRFRQNFVGPVRGNGHFGGSSGRQGMSGSTTANDQAFLAAASQANCGANINGPQDMGMAGLDGSSGLRGDNTEGMFDDWLAQPFDPGIAPFELGGSQFQSGFEIGSLDFLWNLPG